MIKREELANPLSCMSRANDDEMTFVLLGRDRAAPVAIAAWIEERVRLGKNTYNDAQIQEALSCAYRMMRERCHPDTVGTNPTVLSLDGQQAKVTEWAIRCFGRDAVMNPRVRAVRLAEEAIEFAQAVGCDPVELHRLIDYVFSRPAGDPAQELGGVGVGWVAAATAAQESASVVLADEIQRITSLPPEHFTKRNQAKVDLGFTGSAAATEPPPPFCTCAVSPLFDGRNWTCPNCGVTAVPTAQQSSLDPAEYSSHLRSEQRSLQCKCVPTETENEANFILDRSKCPIHARQA